MTHYVAGFFFDMQCEKVWMIKKNKPDWQKGLYNGIGGKIEEGETPYAAMMREFKEETGHTVYGIWKQFCVITGKDWKVHFFYVVAEEDAEFWKPKTTTDESINWMSICRIENNPTISNIPWLIHLALDTEINGIEYKITN